MLTSQEMIHTAIADPHTIDGGVSAIDGSREAEGEGLPRGIREAVGESSNQLATAAPELVAGAHLAPLGRTRRTNGGRFDCRSRRHHAREHLVA